MISVFATNYPPRACSGRGAARSVVEGPPALLASFARCPSVTPTPPASAHHLPEQAQGGFSQ